mmetsp:Transcript_61574/g.169242  ORF Transcript_61574/g.169242 Transcript_61574/m.169242 type:complete len:369 (-) Transcript_61574:113-1219(-)
MVEYFDTDTESWGPITWGQFYAVHEKRVHVGIISADFSGFFHLHPDDFGDGRELDPSSPMLNVTLALPRAGVYRAFLSFAVHADPLDLCVAEEATHLHYRKGTYGATTAENIVAVAYTLANPKLVAVDATSDSVNRWDGASGRSLIGLSLPYDDLYSGVMMRDDLEAPCGATAVNPSCWGARIALTNLTEARAEAYVEEAEAEAGSSLSCDQTDEPITCNDNEELDTNVTVPLVEWGTLEGGEDVAIDTSHLGTECVGVQLTIRNPGLYGDLSAQLRPLLGAPSHAFVARRSESGELDLDRVWHLHLGTPASFAASLNTNGVLDMCMSHLHGVNTTSTNFGPTLLGMWKPEGSGLVSTVQRSTTWYMS